MSAQFAIVEPRRIKATHRRRRKVAAGPIVQRYYDPGIGRFLSVDSMAADTTTGWNFNRYSYAANNPYRFRDPDGRAITEQSEDTGLASFHLQYTLSVKKFNVLREGRPSPPDQQSVANLLGKIVSDGRLVFQKKADGPTIDLNIIDSPRRSSIVTVVNLGTNSAQINFSPIHSLMIGSVRQRPRLLLFHELMHVYDGFHNGMMPGRGDSSRDNAFIIPAEREYARSLGLPWRNSHDEGELVRYGEDD